MTSKYYISLVPVDRQLNIPGERVWIREYINPISCPNEDYVKFIAINKHLFNFIKNSCDCKMVEKDWTHMKCYTLELS